MCKDKNVNPELYLDSTHILGTCIHGWKDKNCTEVFVNWNGKLDELHREPRTTWSLIFVIQGVIVEYAKSNTSREHIRRMRRTNAPFYISNDNGNRGPTTSTLLISEWICLSFFTFQPSQSCGSNLSSTS